MKGKERTMSRARFVLLLVALVLTMLIAGAVVLYVVGKRAAPSLQPDPNVRVGTLQISEEDRKAQLQKKVDESMVNFSINASPYFTTPTAHGNLMIENLRNSQNRFTVQICKKDTGEVVYQSGYIDPGQYIENAALQKKLQPGKYAAVAYFTAYRRHDNSLIGKAGANITLYIDNRQGG